MCWGVGLPCVPWGGAKEVLAAVASACCPTADALCMHRQVFLLTVAPLVAFYVGFALFLYPSADLLHPHGLFTALAPAVPIGLHGLLKVGLTLDGSLPPRNTQSTGVGLTLEGPLSRPLTQLTGSGQTMVIPYSSTWLCVHTHQRTQCRFLAGA